MAPEGTQGGRGRGDFFRVITEAVADFSAHGFDSQARLDHWMRRIRMAAMATLTPEYVVEAELRAVLQSAYQSQVERGLILRQHPGVPRFTIDRVKPRLRAELDRRIMSSANLIRLNRAQSVDRTLQRFSGWATSIPAGGSKVVAKVETKQEIRKALAQLPFEERRVAIDQGHKLVASLHEIIAVDGGALAAIWHSHWRQPGYDYRPDHKERDLRVYLVRGNWALAKGLIKAGPAGYTDQITRPAEEPFCGCQYEYIYALRDLPDEMLTEKGRVQLAAARIAA